MSTVDEIKYNFDVGARGNRYDVNFFLPVNLFGTKAQPAQEEVKNAEGEVTQPAKEAQPAKHGNSRTMGLRVESCSLPGRSISTTGWAAQGQERQMPDGVIDDGGTIDFSFICDQSFADRLIIEAWNHSVFSAKSDLMEREAPSAFPVMSWYDDFIGRVEIIQRRIDGRGKEGGSALKYTLEEAYPVSFDEMSLGHAEDGIMKFKCTFAYRYWKSEYYDAPKRSLLNKGRGLLDALLGGSNLLSRFGKEGKVRKTLTNLDTRTSQINNIFGGG
jgi:hypothetical protein